ncbi:MAG: hypothetical protein ACRDT6_14620 [Micromonosporaceae bacterium]
MSESARSRAYTWGLRSVVAGAGLAAAGIAAEAVASAWFWYAERFETGPSALVTGYAVGRTLLGAALVTTVLWLWHRARQRDTAHTGLAVLMFGGAALTLGSVVPTGLGLYATHGTAWRVGAVPVWVTAAWATSLATLPLLTLLGTLAGLLLIRPTAAVAGSAGRPDPDHPSTSVVRRRPPAIYRGALDAVGIGLVLAVANLVLDAIAAWSSWRYGQSWVPSHGTIVLGYLAVRTVVGGGLLALTVALRRRAVRGEASGRVGLATLMFTCAPLAAAAMLTSSVAYQTLLGAYPLAVYGSLATAAALLLVALIAGPLLLLPASRTYTESRTAAATSP